MKEIRLEPLSDIWTKAIYAANTGNVSEYFYLFESEQAAAAWVREALAQVPAGKLEYVIVDAESSGFVGMISPRISSSGIADIGMWIAESAQRKGYGKAALRAVIDMLSSDPKVKQIDYVTDRRNTQSIGLATSVGMRLVGGNASEAHFMFSRE
jgi:RimJ/RimL family protein N-acetyltransferase